MPTITPNLRKAAVLIHSLDALTAADLLGHLAPEEAAAVRKAVEALGPIDPDEKAGLASELRRAVPMVRPAAQAGVELSLSSMTYAEGASAEATSERWPSSSAPTSDRHAAHARFEFLERAPIASLVPYLSREHVQTIAVVLSYLSPARAAAVLAALPPQLQANTVERLSALGETDPDSLKVVEQELAAWVTAQSVHRRERPSKGAVSAILNAADEATREGILANLKTHKRHLATLLGDESQKLTSNHAPPSPRRIRLPSEKEREVRTWSTRAIETERQQSGVRRLDDPTRNITPDAPAEISREARRTRRTGTPPAPFEFDDLLQLDSRMLATVLQDVDANVLVLALAGSSDELVERIAGGMPKRTVKTFRRRLRELGPTRLSDVSAAQRVVAHAAAERLGARQRPMAV